MRLVPTVCSLYRYRRRGQCFRSRCQQRRLYKWQNYHTIVSMAPLRDRPPFNSSESEWPPQSITPLRIAKRDTQQKQHASQLSRRSSNTFAKLTRSNLVSQSPFLSQPSPAPTPSRPSSISNAPSPRRVSGEKRPRPDSMHSQGENGRPLGFKRRQSKGFQDLMEKEPVSKSPFRRPPSADDDPFPPPPPPPKVLHTSHLPTPSSSASPGRSSLVSKRLHGPRLIGHDVAKRQRRKTVTFDETCDVLTFERDDSLEEELFSDDNDGDSHEMADYDAPVGGIEANDSITGLVDSMLQDARGTSSPQTPPMDRSLPPHMDSEDGIPYGRTHHSDRATHSRHSHPTPPLDIPETLTADSKQSPSLVSTPPQGPSIGSAMPLGRSTHSERARAERMPDDVGEDVQMLPPSPSPAKALKYPFGDRSESLVPKFDLGVHQQEGAGKHDKSFMILATQPLNQGMNQQIRLVCQHQRMSRLLNYHLCHRKAPQAYHPKGRSLHSRHLKLLNLRKSSVSVHPTHGFRHLPHP